ncbi:MutS-related protein [Chitinophaga sp. ARDCPP14]|uniref:MutS-related protein n=1 Tax=Chitinophaga sp. ARDCPP14 TaxID=3391139 RepID=UPI003F525A0A
MTPADIYQQRIHQFREAIKKEKRLTASLSWARLASFLVMVAGIVFFIRSGWEAPWLLVTAAGMLAFIVLLIWYSKAQQKLQLFKSLLELNEKEWQLVTTGQSAFDDGNEFVDDSHDFSSDLDVFGPSSVFQHINRTGTLSGRRQLAAALRDPLEDAPAILATQEALQVLTPELEFRQLLTANAMLAKEEESDRREISAWLEMPFHFLHNKFINVVIWLSPLLVTGSIVYYAITGKYYPLLILIMLNWLLLGASQKKIMAQYVLISHKERILDKFSILLHLIKNGSFKKSALLQQQQDKAKEADVALRQLSKICNAFDQRLNLLIGLGLNSLMLYDLHCILRLERWKKQHKQHITGWFDVITQLEVWNSLATYAFNHPEFSWPAPQAEGRVLEATALGHPLIPANECVKNDGATGRKDHFLIITGSNMSGKSTFLRSVGSNLLLAMCGAPVCADRFVFSPMRIMTSMRIKDSIASHTSYFQAELLRLQHIIHHLKTGARVFILLDEILKGTNSEDKLSGSRSLIEHFLQYNCLGMIATHDLELGQLESAYPHQIRNYCFESTIQDNHLFFDYRIREGIARNKNATFLMKQMEII